MLTLAIAIARGWTWLYTCWMEPPRRDERRAEIESDLWECQADAYLRGGHPIPLAASVMARVILGVPDDILWRLEQRPLETSSKRFVGAGVT